MNETNDKIYTRIHYTTMKLISNASLNYKQTCVHFIIISFIYLPVDFIKMRHQQEYAVILCNHDILLIR